MRLAKHQKSSCELCSKLLGAYDGMYVVEHTEDGEHNRLVCLKCYNLWTGHNINVQQLLRQIKHNERYDRCINAIVPTNKRGNYTDIKAIGEK